MLEVGEKYFVKIPNDEMIYMIKIDCFYENEKIRYTYYGCDNGKWYPIANGYIHKEFYKDWIFLNIKNKEYIDDNTKWFGI